MITAKWQLPLRVKSAHCTFRTCVSNGRKGKSSLARRGPDKAVTRMRLDMTNQRRQLKGLMPVCRIRDQQDKAAASYAILAHGGTAYLDITEHEQQDLRN